MSPLPANQRRQRLMSDVSGLPRLWTHRLSHRLVAALSVVGLILLAGFILVGAHQETLTYRFDPATSEGGDPAVAVLGLAREVPDTATITLPCEVPGAEFRSSATYLWTPTDPTGGPFQSPIVYDRLGPGLHVTVAESSIDVVVGDAPVLSQPVVARAGCVAVLRYEAGHYELAVGSVTAQADGPEPLFSEGSFGGAAVGSPIAEVIVTTRELGTSPSASQIVFLVLATLVFSVVVRQIFLDGEAEKGGDDDRAASSTRLRMSLVDLAVLGGIVMWVFLIPPYFDDGWVIAIQRSFDQHGAFSAVYENQAAISPVGYWLGWVQNLLLGFSSTPVLMRIPIALLGGLTWLLLRRTARDAGLVEAPSARWVMALVFVAGFGAWGMTLRPEPVISLLLVVSVSVSVRFVLRPRAGTLLGLVAVAACALTAHPAGVIVGAPLVAVAGPILRWMRAERGRILTVVSIAAVFIGLVLTLLFVDSDLATKAETFESIQSDRHSNSVFDEALRYQMLVQAPAGTPMRRASVALGGIALAAFALSGAGERRGVRGIPGRSLVWAFALLALTPSKWPWHFGGLVGLIALSVAVYPLAGGRRILGRRPAPIIVAGLMVAAMAWSWSGNPPWASFDLRTQQWWVGAVNLLPVDLSSMRTWAALGVVMGGTMWAVRSRGRRLPWTWLPQGLIVVAASLLVAVTASTFMLDAVRTRGWTFSRQNVHNALGRADCGLIDEFVIPVSGSLRELAAAPEPSSPTSEPGFSYGVGFADGAFPQLGLNTSRPLDGMKAVGSWLPDSASSPELAVGGMTSEWFVVDGASDHVALMVMGSFEDLAGAEVALGSANAVAIEWGRSDGSRVEPVIADYPELWRYFTDWSLVLFERPEGADRVRLLLRDDTVDAPDGWVASSMPLGVSVASLGAVVSGPNPPDVLVTPPFMLYLPCVPIPQFDGPRVRPPDVMILQRHDMWETTYASAASADRYFSTPMTISPDRDVDQVVFVYSQRYLTGSPARVNGEFRLVDDPS